jgi:serine/threonine protein kinase
MPLAEDTILENRYRIDGPLAFGGMGAVYRAFDTNLQIEVAIKENYFSTPQAIEQFRREALILARLRHPALPRVLQHFEHEDQQYLVMELIHGLNLWELIKERSKPFSAEQAVTWIDKICEAVTYLHSQTPPIIHRDIKPQNIKVMPNNQVVLVDFGVAKEGSASAHTATGARGVTPGFSPPEQYSGSGSSPASDIYALGATLYALLTGRKPPDSVSLAIGEVEYVPPDKLNPSISPAVNEAITWAMQPRPGNRPQTVEAWRQRLRQVASVDARQEPVTSPEPGKDQILELPNPPKEADLTPHPPAPVCSTCGAPIRPGLKFCEECGSPLGSSGHACPECGAQNPPEMRFCEECGKPLT